jgi:uncharacterized protein
MKPTSNPLPPAPADPTPVLPWWRVGMVWLVLSGPLSVVVASLATAVIAWRHIDPVIPVNREATAEEVVPADLKSPLAPAMKARNHAATPQN